MSCFSDISEGLVVGCLIGVLMLLCWGALQDDDDDDEDDDEDDEEDDEYGGDDIRDEVSWNQSISNQQLQLPTGKPKANNKEAKKYSPVVDLLDQINSSELFEYVGHEGGDEEEEDEDEDEDEDYIEDLEN
jgi:hypothetical protein